jgi:hypothetical protein
MIMDIQVLLLLDTNMFSDLNKVWHLNNQTGFVKVTEYIIAKLYWMWSSSKYSFFSLYSQMWSLGTTLGQILFKFRPPNSHSVVSFHHFHI